MGTYVLKNPQPTTMARMVERLRLYLAVSGANEFLLTDVQDAGASRAATGAVLREMVLLGMIKVIRKIPKSGASIHVFAPINLNIKPPAKATADAEVKDLFTGWREHFPERFVPPQLTGTLRTTLNLRDK